MFLIAAYVMAQTPDPLMKDGIISIGSNVNGRNYKRAEVSPGKWEWVPNEEADRRVNERENERLNMFAALTTRVVTEKELSEILKIGWQITVRNMVSYREGDKVREFNQALATQRELRALAEPTKKLAPDGVNWVTENHDGSQSVTLAHVRNRDAPQVATLEEIAKTRGRLVIDKADAEEVVPALEAAIATGEFAESLLQLDIRNEKITLYRRNSEAVLGDVQKRLALQRALLAKWRARADSLPNITKSH
jgi:hypothetical protein